MTSERVKRERIIGNIYYVLSALKKKKATSLVMSFNYDLQESLYNVNRLERVYENICKEAKLMGLKTT